MSTLDVGDAIPEFSPHPASSGDAVGSAELSKGPSVLFFYPKADTPGCTKEACRFRDLSAEFAELGVSVYGVSKDTLKAQEKFRDKYELTMPLLADPEKTLCESFGVMKEKNMYGKKVFGIERSTFLIGADGKLAAVWRKVKVDGHVDAVLEACKAL